MDSSDARRDSLSRSLFSDFTSKRRKRRDAVRIAKVQQKIGHQFRLKFFPQPTFCSVCGEFLWGFGKQGYQCTTCGSAIHDRCFDKVVHKCFGNHSYSMETVSKEPIAEVDHQFLEKTYLTPTFCFHCGQLLVGIFKQGLRCQQCGYDCHKKCAKNVPKNCRNNQTSVAQVLKLKGNSDSNERLTQLVRNSAFSIDKLVQKAVNDAIEHEKEIQIEKFDDSTGYKQSIEDFTILRLLGKGSFGQVFLVTLNSNSTFYAMKTLRKDQILEEDDLKCAFLERDMYLMGNQNRFLTKLFCSFQNQVLQLWGLVKRQTKSILSQYFINLNEIVREYLFMVMEFVIGGDLFFQIEKSEKFPESQARFYAAEIICALQFLHEKGIIYRDLKLDNILLDAEGHIKLTDFGMCARLNSKGGKTTTFCGTPDYMAPEIISGMPYSFEVDFWSLGVLIFEMLCAYSPFHGPDEKELFKAIVEHPVEYPRSMSSLVKSLLNGLLERDPEKRLGSVNKDESSIRSHPFFAETNWEKVENCQVEPPFKPKVISQKDVSYFDKQFTQEPPNLAKIDPNLLKTIDNSLFRGFSFVNRSYNPS